MYENDYRMRIECSLTLLTHPRSSILLQCYVVTMEVVNCLHDNSAFNIAIIHMDLTTSAKRIHEAVPTSSP
jgi:hypothetical protein